MARQAVNLSILIRLLFGEWAYHTLTGLSFGGLVLLVGSVSWSCLTYSHARYAIKGSPTQKLLLEDIYYAIESRVRILSFFTYSVELNA